jgi:hypothetical protein
LQKQQQAALAANRPLRLRMQVRSFDAVCHMVARAWAWPYCPGGLPAHAARHEAATRPLADAWARRTLLVATVANASDPAVQALWAFLAETSLRKRQSVNPQAVMDASGWARCTLPPMDTTTPAAGPLAGLKVLELGQLIAGPFAAKTLADFGADVVKIEPPGAGDPLRKWRLLKDGTSVWWQVQSRNKRSVALDLRDPEARTSCASWPPRPTC